MSLANKKKIKKDAFFLISFYSNDRIWNSNHLTKDFNWDEFQLSVIT